MTIRLEFQDAYRQQFEAEVVDLRRLPAGPVVVLDRSCFYPASGGQLHDLGQLAGVAVAAVAVEQGVVLHRLAAVPPFGVGDRVAGQIDWARRYDQMQQHSGQHLLSQLIHRLYSYETVAVHFGSEESTLDLDCAELSPAALAEIEEAANQLACRALAIRSYFVDEQAAAALPLRRPPQVTGPIRIVEIDGYDYSACGGTHVHTTAELTPLKLIRQERRRGQSRLTFLCGLRAWRDYAEKHRLLAAAASLCSTELAAVPAAVQRLQLQNQMLFAQSQRLQEQLLVRRAAELAVQAVPVGSWAVVAFLSDEDSPETLKELALRICQSPQTVGLLVSTADGRLTAVFARSDDVQLHMGELLRAVLALFGGRGGGRPELAQGGGVAPSAAAELLVQARQLLAQKAG